MRGVEPRFRLDPKIALGELFARFERYCGVPQHSARRTTPPSISGKTPSNATKRDASALVVASPLAAEPFTYPKYHWMAVPVHTDRCWQLKDPMAVHWFDLSFSVLFL